MFVQLTLSNGDLAIFVERARIATLPKVTKPGHVGSLLSVVDRMTSEKRTLKQVPASTAFTDVIFSLGAGHAANLWHICPVDGTRDGDARDLTAGAEEARTGALGIVANVSFAGDEMEASTGEAQ